MQSRIDATGRGRAACVSHAFAMAARARCVIRVMRYAMRNQQSAISNRQSAIGNQQ
ncbi:hypothetical protein [Burkholderia vietnamiensis]|uniref:hypothetical protein n=1 Tax=Burkholderia vietnamiensis TaxID=60552 RepID=UPI0012D86D54|nr:hypothetical protein [Burkholderia vietnamiensis]MDN7927674.1 hypothetical protein [Burkholderia vietnamiensis]HDR9248733.1 hypothetical protein [Burkholderia vietnamiensis]